MIGFAAWTDAPGVETGAGMGLTIEPSLGVAG